VDRFASLYSNYRDKGAMTGHAECRSQSSPPHQRSVAAKLLPAVLSLTAGSVDVISFLGLGGLFTAHITGNLVVLAARIVAGDEASLALMLSVPVFIVVLAITQILATGLQRIRVGSLRPLLILQFLLLAGFLALSVGFISRLEIDSARATIAGMLGVSAMAVQNALVQISLVGEPSTAVMTTNITHFVIDLGQVLFARNSNDRAKAGERARRTGLAIAGFIAGCGLGAGCEAIAGLWSLMLPACLSLMALAIALGPDFDDAQSRIPCSTVIAETDSRPADSQASVRGALRRASAP
jgi:uncharacterized membrane protein YoaK (UPF0700 family)